MSTTLEELIVKVGADVGDAESKLGGLSKFADSTLGKITLGSAAAGGALEAFARSQADSNVATRQLAQTLGVSEDAMRDYATETANAGFPLAEVLDLMETGRQRGLSSADALKEYATFWDMVGDASGESATQLGQAGVALAAVGIEAGDEGEALGALGFIHQNTTNSIADFLGFVQKTGPELRTMGADVNDAAAVLGILERDFGMTGRTARSEFNAAVTEADGDMGKLLETLGITPERFAAANAEVEASGGVIEQHSAIVDQSITPLQKLQNEAQEMAYQYGGLADVAGMLAVPLMALGPALGAAKWVAETAKMVAYKTASLATQAATKVWAGVQWLLNTALLASPITWIVLAIIALVAIIVLIATKTTWFQDIWRVTWDWIKKAAAAVGSWFVDTLWGKWIKGAWNSIVDAGQSALDWFKKLPGLIGDAFKGLVNIITWPWRTAFNFISDAWNNTIGKLSWSVPSWVPFIGGNTISAPRLPTLSAFHTGGIVPGSGDVPILAKGGEGVFTREQMAALGGTGAGQLVLRGDGTRAMALMIELFRAALRTDPAFRAEVSAA
jgi:hypothetical protein